MATVTKYKINGVETEPFREAQEINVAADFGTETQPSIDINSIELVDSAGALNSTTLRNLWANNPAEGAPFNIEITDGLTSFDFDFYFDYTKMVFTSDVETEVGLKKNKSLDQFDFRAQGITQELLNFKGLFGNNDWQPIPYVVENRKTLLEQVYLVGQTYTVIKTIVDEVHKLLNIASDIPTIGSAAAFANLAASIAAITTLSAQLKTLLEQIQEAFFPPVRYHSGIKPATFITRAVQYMGYDGVEFGTLTSIMNRLAWCGSKNNEKGTPQYLLVGIPTTALQLKAGLFKPGDQGFFLTDCIDILTNQFRLRRAIIDNVLHLRPENDPFWISQSGYQLPDVKVEQVYADNGTIKPNYDDVNSSLIVEYSTDDSDLWTLEDLADEADENSTGKIISVKTIEPLQVTDQRKVLLKGSKIVNIPHCLASRKDQIDDLLTLFLGTADEFNAFKDTIENILAQWGQVLGAGNPAIDSFVTSLGNRTGAMKVENDYFSIPKQMLLEENGQGLPTIPATFADEIGAKALIQDFHSWDSFIPGERNPQDPNQTAAKLLYEQVRIPFGLNDFATILNNAYFTTLNGEVGKFTKVDWNVRGDFAIVDYWIYNNWMTNIEENIS